MSFLSSFNISGSGMTAERFRMDIVAENIANIHTTRTPNNGGTYRRKLTVFQERTHSNSFKGALETAMKGRLQATDSPGLGVRVTRVVEDQTELTPSYDPSHPDADENGYVMLPNVDLIKETVDAMSATRAYEANVTAFNALKVMAQKAMEVGQ